jgi:predicted transposase/invertase (TIGR01784 family)
MKESVIYQSILLEGMAEGKAKGKAEGMAEGMAEGEAKTTKQIALKMLRSNIAVDLVVQITGLSLKQIQKLQKPDTKLPKTSRSLKKSRSPNSV